MAGEYSSSPPEGTVKPPRCFCSIKIMMGFAHCPLYVLPYEHLTLAGTEKSSPGYCNLELRFHRQSSQLHHLKRGHQLNHRTSIEKKTFLSRTFSQSIMNHAEAAIVLFFLQLWVTFGIVHCFAICRCVAWEKTPKILIILRQGLRPPSVTCTFCNLFVVIQFRDLPFEMRSGQCKQLMRMPWCGISLPYLLHSVKSDQEQRGEFSITKT